MNSILISSPIEIAEEVKTLTSLFDAGLDIFHLRKPGFTESQYIDIIEEIPAEYYEMIVIHDYFHLVERYSLKGIHFSTSKRVDYNKFHYLKCHKSTSCHGFAEIESLEHNYDYMFLSPVFDSISKVGYSSAFDLTKLKEFAHSTDQNIVALGGIDENSINKLSDIYFYGVAILGAIWYKKEVGKRVEAFREIYQT